MDPLDQRLRDAGNDWREAQPEPPDLNRLIAGFPRRRTGFFAGFFEGRLMYAVLAALLLVAAIAAAPGVGGLLHPVTSPPPVASATPMPRPSQALTGASPAPGNAGPSASAALGDAAMAMKVVDDYEAALVAGRWQTAFDLLAATSPTHQTGLTAFSSERAAYFRSVAGRYVIGAPVSVTDWAGYAPLVPGADEARASLIQVDYPALAGNNAGFEQFVVAPDPSGTWRIWPVR